MQRLSKANGGLVSVVLFLAFMALPAPPATSQDRQPSSSARVTASDIQRLQDAIYDTGTDIRRLQGQNANQAERLQGRLDDLRDEVIYLKVKLRKDAVSRSEYNELRDAIDGVRAEARGAAPATGADVRPADHRLSGRHPAGSSGEDHAAGRGPCRHRAGRQVGPPDQLRHGPGGGPLHRDDSG